MNRKIISFVFALAGGGLLAVAQPKAGSNSVPSYAQVRQKSFQSERVLQNQRPAPPQEALREAPQVTAPFQTPTATAVLPVQKPNRPVIDLMDATSVKAVESGRNIQRAQQLNGRGDYTGAIRLLETAEAEAWRSGDREAAGLAALNHARTLQGASVANPKSGIGPEKIIVQYKSAISNAAPAQQTLARNNLGTLYLRQNNYAAATEVLRGIDWRQVDSAQEHLCRFNLGRAEELAGNTNAALEQYRRAIRLRPDFAPGVDATFRLLAANLPETATLAEELVRAGEAEAAARHLRSALQRAADRAGVPLLMTALVRCYIALRLTPPDYFAREQPALDRAAETSAALRPLTKDTHRAFAGEVTMTFNPSDALKMFPGWSNSAPQREVFSRLLQQIGEYHARALTNGSPEQSLKRAAGCYTVAWALDRSNTDAALYAATILHEHRKTLDANGTALNDLIRGLFEDKGERYKIAIKTREDWLNLMRLHVVLATVFEARPNWGSEYDPQSVIFQLHRAIQIETVLRRDDPSFVPSPQLYARLARAFEMAQRKSDASLQYLKAAEGFAFFRQETQSRAALNNAMRVQPTLNSIETTRIKGLESTLEKLTRNEPGRGV